MAEIKKDGSPNTGDAAQLQGSDAVGFAEFIAKGEYYFKNNFWYQPGQSIRFTHKQLYTLFKSTK